MRFSYAKGDLGRVWLDGQPLRMVRECDTAEGWAEVVVTDADGRIVINGDEVATKIVRGHVRFSRAA